MRGLRWEPPRCDAPWDSDLPRACSVRPAYEGDRIIGGYHVTAGMRDSEVIVFGDAAPEEWMGLMQTAVGQAHARQAGRLEARANRAAVVAWLARPLARSP